MSATEKPINVEELLDGIPLPAEKTEIVSYAEDQGASEEALDLLNAMPEGDYKTLKQINSGIGLTETLPGEEDNVWVSQKGKHA